MEKDKERIKEKYGNFNFDELDIIEYFHQLMTFCATLVLQEMKDMCMSFLLRLETNVRILYAVKEYIQHI